MLTYADVCRSFVTELQADQDSLVAEAAALKLQVSEGTWLSIRKHTSAYVSIRQHIYVAEATGLKLEVSVSPSEGTPFACFTSSKVQTWTQKLEVSEVCCLKAHSTPRSCGLSLKYATARSA